MTKLNTHYLDLQGSYLFATIAQRVRSYKEKNPQTPVISLGIGDVSQPLVPAVVEALVSASQEMGKPETFHGYGPEQGYAFLREAIATHDYQQRNLDISPDEIFISDGAKSDVANFQELFSQDTVVALQDPVYPVYLDTNVMAGRSGKFLRGRFEKIVYLPCVEENQFVPQLPRTHVDIIYLCSPNNPTGAALTKKQLATWVDYAREHKSIILFDSAYEAYISQPDLPHSIYEIDGAREVAVEFRSFSKTAGFTGTRCAYTVVPRTVRIYDEVNHATPLHGYWLRRQTTKFNGVPYIIQRGAQAVYTEQGQQQIKQVIAIYAKNAQVILNAVRQAGLTAFGGQNAPYIWLKTPKGIDSWTFFDQLLEQVQIVGTPGVGFGACGEGYFRLTAFNTPQLTEQAAQRITQLKL